MIYADFKNMVEAIFPVPFNDSIIKERDGNGIDKILNVALRKAFSKFDKIKSLEINESTTIPDAISVLKVVPATGLRSKYDVFYYMFRTPTQVPGRVDWYFSPERRLILRTSWVSISTTAVYIEYKVDPEYLQIEDLDSIYIDWTVNYAVALLKIKEGFLGKSSVLTSLPFDYNYEDLLTSGKEEKENLEKEIEEMYFGLFSAKS